jgi:hypothetical protein
MRCVIRLTSKACAIEEIQGWRKHAYLNRKIRNLFHVSRRKFSYKPKTEKNKIAREKELKSALEAYLTQSCHIIEKAKETVQTLRIQTSYADHKIEEIEKYIKYAEIQINQIQRRHFLGETIPHAEKIFSIFQEHTEWISKGKAGVSQELGIRVCILEDQYRFILHHRVMRKTTDEKITVPMTREAKDRFPDLNSCSYDQGFYAPGIREQLAKIIDQVILPKKGRLTKSEKEIQTSEAFISARRQHSAVESAINALENHGLDRCPDHGIDGFNRYVALGIVGKNLHRLGHILQQKELKESQVSRKAA